MKSQNDNRVLSRIQARELTRHEIEEVGGGLMTKTKCTFIPPNTKDGDPGEC